MTTAADDSAVEDAFEAYLAGRPVPEEAAGTFHGVAAFAEAVRATAAQPGRPNAALAELLATGLLADQSSPSTRAAISAGVPPSRGASRVRRRRRFAMFIPALLAKLLSAGAVAQAASGAGVVLVAFVGAGAADVLPTPVQDTVATVVETVTPLDLPDSGDTEGAATEAPATDEPSADETTPAEPTDVVGETEAPAPEDAGLTLEKWQEGPAPDQSFGSWVSQGARLGYADGSTISGWAHQRNEDRKADVTAPATAEPTGEAEVEDAGVERDHRGDGQDNGNGQDNGTGQDNGNGHRGGGGRGHN
jgi:hypothetical protein